MNRTILTVLLFCLNLFTACPVAQSERVENYFIGRDRQAPVLLSLDTSDERTVRVEFDEPISSCVAKTVDADPLEAALDERKVLITLPEVLPPGENIHLSVRVADRAGNTTTLSRQVSGINTRLPRLRLNEFTSKGTATQPDRIELAVLSDGNMAGVHLYDGMYLNHTSLFVFPSYEVNTGDYVVLQYSVEENLHDHPHFFYAGEEGLGGNNGVISVYRNSTPDIIDALPYSDRSNDSDTEYGGFGTAQVFQEVQELEQYHLWESEPITPENSVRSDHTTSTRSINRREDGETAFNAEQWYTVPTSSLSFSQTNCIEQYSP